MRVIYTILLSFFLFGCKTTEQKINYGLNHYEMGLFGYAAPSLLDSTPEFEKNNPNDPRVSRAYLALGTMENSNKMHERAEKYMLKALSSAENIKPTNIVILRNAKNTLGNFYISQKRFKEALPQLESAVEISKNKTGNYILRSVDLDNLALVMAELGKSKKATSYSNEALKLVEKGKQDRLYYRTKGIILYNKGKHHEKFNEFNKAQKCYKESISNLNKFVENNQYDAWRVDLVNKSINELMFKINDK